MKAKKKKEDTLKVHATFDQLLSAAANYTPPKKKGKKKPTSAQKW